MSSIYNTLREKQARLGSKTQRRRRYNEIVKELGARHITLYDIAKDNKPEGFLDMLETTGATLDDAVVLQQYANAIIDRSTKAAEFLRDTAGDKPTTMVEVQEKSGIQEMSLDELFELRDLLTKSDC